MFAHESTDGEIRLEQCFFPARPGFILENARVWARTDSGYPRCLVMVRFQAVD